MTWLPDHSLDHYSNNLINSKCDLAAFKSARKNKSSKTQKQIKKYIQTEETIQISILQPRNLKNMRIGLIKTPDLKDI